jgi:putative restriction endonuclease
MRFWWVNQKQTHRQEIGGGYSWSPKRRSDASRNQFYENMKVVAPGDAVFCYWQSAVRARGTLRSFGYDAPKLDQFGEAGRNWSQIGYRADVEYTPLRSPVRPRDEWFRIKPLLPTKHSPLHRERGIGLQSVYLAALPDELGYLLADLVARDGNLLQVADVRAMPPPWSVWSVSAGSFTSWTIYPRPRSVRLKGSHSFAHVSVRESSGRT